MRSLILAPALLTLFACAQAPVEPSITSAQQLQSIIASPLRYQSDIKRDEARKPSQVLEFSSISSGMKVLDVFSGGGYYVELLSALVGPTGQVYEHNNDAYLSFIGKEHSQRYQNNRLNNVKHLHSEASDIKLSANQLDAVTMMLAIHDIYYADASFNWPLVDRKQFFSQLYQALKPGGVLLIVDHHASHDSDHQVTKTLHRINANLVQQELESYGFTLAATSPILENNLDQLNQSAVKPEMIGKTSRFVHKYLKK